MSRIYKLSIKNHYDGVTVKMLAVKPSSDTFASFKEEIFRRFPALDKRKLELYYEDADADKISIILSNDFEIFKQRKIDKAFVIANSLQTWSFFVKNDDAAASLSSEGNASCSIVNVESILEPVQVKVEGEQLQLTERAEKRKLDAENGDDAEMLGTSRNEIPTTTGDPTAKRAKRPRWKKNRRPRRRLILKSLLEEEKYFS